MSDGQRTIMIWFPFLFQDIRRSDLLRRNLPKQRDLDKLRGRSRKTLWGYVKEDMKRLGLTRDRGGSKEDREAAPSEISGPCAPPPKKKTKIRPPLA